jgi:hypothetical protein
VRGGLLGDLGRVASDWMANGRLPSPKKRCGPNPARFGLAMVRAQGAEPQIGACLHTCTSTRHVFPADRYESFPSAEYGPDLETQHSSSLLNSPLIYLLSVTRIQSLRCTRCRTSVSIQILTINDQYTYLLLRPLMVLFIYRLGRYFGNIL